MTGVAYDSAGSSPYINSTSANPTLTHVIGGTANAILVHVAWDSTDTTVSGAKVGTTSLTLLENLNFTGTSHLSVYGLSPAQGTLPTGSQTITVTATSSSGGLGVAAQSVAYTGVASFGTPATGSGGLFSGNASVTASSSSGNMVANSIATSSTSSGALGSYSQTSRLNLATGTSDPLVVGDAAGSSSVTFTATTANFGWGAVAVNLVAGGGGNSFTDGANQTVTFGRSTNGVRKVTDTANRSIAWANSPSGPHAITDGANRSVTVSRSTGGVRGAKSGANSTVTFTPTVVGPTGPFAGALAKLNAGTGITLQFWGDSTVEGVGDTTSSPFLSGWVGRFGINLGTFYNMNVVVCAGGSGGSSFIYGSPTTLFTATPNTRPTITLYNGGVGGTSIFYQDFAFVALPGYAAVTNPDACFIGTGINDLDLGNGSTVRTPSQFAGDMQTFLTDLYQLVDPNTPIIVTTENPVDTAFVVDTTSGVDAMLEGLGVASPGMPMSPLVQPSTFTCQVGGTGPNVANVWAMDTQAAFGYVNTAPNALFGDSYHPTSVGYTQEASWVTFQLAPGTVTAFTDGANRSINQGSITFGRVPRSDHANTSVTVSRPTATVRNVTDTANRSVSVTRSAAGAHAARAGANTTVAFGSSVGGRKALSDAANRSVAAGLSAGTHQHYSAGADGGVVFHPAVSVSHAIRTGVSTAIGFSTAVSVAASFNATGGWAGISGTVVFTPQPASAGNVVRVRLDGSGDVTVNLPVIAGMYLVQFSNLRGPDGAESINPFAFECPEHAIDLNVIAGPAPAPHTWGIAE
jgi:hypothetical protein